VVTPPSRPATAGPPPFQVHVRPAREAVHLVPTGELDALAAPRLRAEVDELVAVGFAHVVIDLREIAFMDCAGLRLLLQLTAEARSARWRLSLIQSSDAVHRLLVLTGTLDVLPFLPPTPTPASGRFTRRRPVGR
jgi:anti-sigma B factor antagonist